MGGGGGLLKRVMLDKFIIFYTKKTLIDVKKCIKKHNFVDIDKFICLSFVLARVVNNKFKMYSMLFISVNIL